MMAKEWSKMSYAKRKQVGCLIVRDGTIISDGYNGMPSGMNNVCEDENNVTKWEVLHAELNAITKCAKNGNSVLGSTMYITLSPCKHCSLLIFQSGIKRVVYCENYRDNEGIEFLKKMKVDVDYIKI